MEESQISYFSDLIEYQGQALGDKPYIMFGEERISFAGYDQATCRFANGLLAHGVEAGDGIAIFMENCPEFLYLFYGVPRAGLYSVPINVSLMGDGLRFILENSDVKYLAIDDTLYPKIAEFDSPVTTIKRIFVRRTTDQPLPDNTIDIKELFAAPSEKPAHTVKEGDISQLLYTSGTTGLPKGVVGRQQPGIALWWKMGADTMFAPDDILYTCLPLFHANALMLTAGFAMAGGRPFGLDVKFTASGFWDRIRFYKATSFNGLGAMIPILIKQPQKDDDTNNPVKIVNSAACPANLWEPFEKRFGVKIYEGYGAVDGGGLAITNRGDGPVGSVGKPAPEIEWRLVDNDENDVAQGEYGELITKNKNQPASKVEYYKNEAASSKKVKGGWIRTGDLFYADNEGYLYFVDRKTDSMRRRGENISSWEVENMVEKYDDVEVCAAFGVPSELAEDEVMIWVKPKDGLTLNLKDLMQHCANVMPYFMVPRFVDVVDDIPRTKTLRVKKTAMKKQGVTDQTWDREAEMPELKLKK
ncbi:MAG: AMP-binding protein [Deltaproteobacteria bacterium]|jgi:carnitine-CoA ligase|nr:AMP-binding protein [Deltaproteobacteria bacterium]MBT4638876.1 AMP-binding protein [Deltaproteobacteria bacterium]MBT6502434.1 AMP-binding protein [Deltaproteobacteria bacterium]MBT7154126.1 AMP-binding protein [Deltaproteobacteria bacterium]MBT7715593.1 AMP-binding protein [Deltaproteobacteria bacterium]